jgi:RimJ/RimL family protein N-acetyltransferase
MPFADIDQDGTVETPRLLLRPWRVSDAVISHELWTERDPRVPAHRRIGADGHPSLHDIEEWVRGYDGQPAPGVLVAALRESGQVVGYCGLIANVYGQADEPELAFEFLRRVWGRGYATEAGSAVVELARALGYRRLWATVRDWNGASRRVLAKLGFSETGRVDRDPAHGDSLFTALTL